METKPGQTKQSGKNFFSTLIFEEDYRYSPPDPNVVVAELLALNACGSVITARTGKHRVFKLVLPASGSGSTFIGLQDKLEESEFQTAKMPEYQAKQIKEENPDSPELSQKALSVKTPTACRNNTEELELPYHNTQL